MDQDASDDQKVIPLFQRIVQNADRNRQILTLQEREINRIHSLFKDHNREDERKTMLLIELNRQQQEFGDIQRQMIEILAAVSLRLELQEALLRQALPSHQSETRNFDLKDVLNGNDLDRLSE